MTTHLLYSTNVYLKSFIQQQFRGDVHYVWCSEYFDSRTLSPYAAGSLVAASSNPADIYRELQRDVKARDTHSAKINAQKASLQSLAIMWAGAGDITDSDKDDIIYMVNNASFDLWRPLLYIVPRTLVASRLKTVAVANRGSFGTEYIVPDLQRSEVDFIEL